MIPANPLFHKPKSIIAAMNIMYAALLLNIINWAITHWTTDLHSNAPTYAVIILIVSVLVVFILIKQIGSGRKWARVVLLVLFVAGLLLYPRALSALFEANMLVGVISLLQTLLAIVALIFLFSKESTQWFNRVHASAQDKPASASKH